MARLLLILMLTLAVGSGFVGNGLDGPCAADDCGLADDGDHGADAGDVDDCPPFCGGCLRLPAHLSTVIALSDVPRSSEAMVAVAPRIPPVAPPSNGLFRPPRA